MTEPSPNQCKTCERVGCYFNPEIGTKEHGLDIDHPITIPCFIERFGCASHSPLHHNQTPTTEEKIQEIYNKADELSNLSGFRKGYAVVKLVRWEDSWHVEVVPSFLTFKGQTAAFTRGYTKKDLTDVLSEALQGTMEELDLYKKGLTRGVFT
jgi:hypothetical protein